MDILSREISGLKQHREMLDNYLIELLKEGQQSSPAFAESFKVNAQVCKELQNKKQLMIQMKEKIKTKNKKPNRLSFSLLPKDQCMTNLEVPVNIDQITGCYHSVDLLKNVAAALQDHRLNCHFNTFMK